MVQTVILQSCCTIPMVRGPVAAVQKVDSRTRGGLLFIAQPHLMSRWTRNTKRSLDWFWATAALAYLQVSLIDVNTR